MSSTRQSCCRRVDQLAPGPGLEVHGFFVPLEECFTYHIPPWKLLFTFFRQWAPVERSQVCIPGTHTMYTDWASLGTQLQAEEFPKLTWGDRLECKKTMPCASATPATKPIIITNKTQTTHALLFQTALPLRIFMKRNANTCALKWVGVKEHSAQLYLGCYRFITCRHIFGAY